MKNVFFRSQTFKNLFETFTYIIADSNLLTNALIKIVINKFWVEIMKPLSKDQVVLILFKIKFLDDNDSPYIRTLGSLLKTNNTELTRIYNILCARLEISDNNYLTTPISEIIITYRIISLNNTKITTITNPKGETLTTQKIYNYTLPTTMNLKLWGRLLSKTDSILRIQKYRSKYIYEIDLISPLIKNIKLLIGKEVILTFKD